MSSPLFMLSVYICGVAQRLSRPCQWELQPVPAPLARSRPIERHCGFKQPSDTHTRHVCRGKKMKEDRRVGGERRCASAPRSAQRQWSCTDGPAQTPPSAPTCISASVLRPHLLPPPSLPLPSSLCVAPLLHSCQPHRRRCSRVGCPPGAARRRPTDVVRARPAGPVAEERDRARVRTRQTERGDTNAVESDERGVLRWWCRRRDWREVGERLCSSLLERTAEPGSASSRDRMPSLRSPPCCRRRVCVTHAVHIRRRQLSWRIPFPTPPPATTTSVRFAPRARPCQPNSDAHTSPVRSACIGMCVSPFSFSPLSAALCTVMVPSSSVPRPSSPTP